MLYLVVYYAGYGDYELEGDEVIAFDNKEKAIEYANFLNIENDCNTTYPYDFYVVMPIQYKRSK